MANTNRLQVDILEHQLDELKELVKLGGLRSKRELWDTAFTVLKWATRKRAQGFSVGSMSEDGAYTELEMPFLEHYAQSVKRQHSSNHVKEKTSGSVERTITGPSPISRTRKTGSVTLLAKKRHTA
ncbi:MAG: hypothetical protein QOH71_2968 [Blastocatellia bacterium]|nr:hypothetical protein [Blastocatellia bacterium]